MHCTVIHSGLHHHLEVLFLSTYVLLFKHCTVLVLKPNPALERNTLSQRQKKCSSIPEDVFFSRLAFQWFPGKPRVTNHPSWPGTASVLTLKELHPRKYLSSGKPGAPVILESLLLHRSLLYPRGLFPTGGTSIKS